jgi:predicted nucleic acid-binding protein
MIFSDSDVFLIDHVYTRDDRHEINRHFIEKLPTLNVTTSIYNLLEICGIAANVLSRSDLERLFYYFDELYEVEIIYPKDSRRTLEEYFRDYAEQMFRLVSKKMKYPDAQILFIAEEYDVSHLVTWNTKDFKGRTNIRIVTPVEFLEESSE